MEFRFVSSNLGCPKHRSKKTIKKYFPFLTDFCDNIGTARNASIIPIEIGRKLQNNYHKVKL